MHCERSLFEVNERANPGTALTTELETLNRRIFERQGVLNLRSLTGVEWWDTGEMDKMRSRVNVINLKT